VGRGLIFFGFWPKSLPTAQILPELCRLSALQIALPHCQSPSAHERLVCSRSLENWFSVKIIRNGVLLWYKATFSRASSEDLRVLTVAIVLSTARLWLLKQN
jgi:hypothetical protein